MFISQCVAQQSVAADFNDVNWVESGHQVNLRSLTENTNTVGHTRLCRSQIYLDYSSIH